MDRWNELERIGRLRDDGLLSADEFEKQKTRILARDDTTSDVDVESQDTDEQPIRRAWTDRKRVWVIGGTLGATAIGLAFATAIGPIAPNSSASAWDRAGTGSPTTCAGHWSYAPSLGQAMNVSIKDKGGSSYDVSIQRVDLNAPASGFVRSENISMLENTTVRDGVLVAATLHDDSGAVTLECRTSGARLKYRDRQIALQRVDTDLKATVAEKGWQWPQRPADGNHAIAVSGYSAPQGADEAPARDLPSSPPSWASDNQVFNRFKFTDYAVAKYAGPIVNPSFKGTQRDFAAYRTRLTDAARSGPDFAGNIAVEAHGCGTGCVAYNFINVQSGFVVGHEPYGGGEEVSYDDLYYRPDSTLLFESFMRSEGGEPNDAKPLTTQCVYNVYRWTGLKLERLASDQRSVDNDAPECP